MDLYHHSSPPFTSWIIQNQLLHEKYVVIDIGCQGGEHPRWSLLGDLVEFHGFDPIREEIENLRREDRPGRTYYDMALGNEDGERRFFVNDNTFGSSFYARREHAPNGREAIARGARMVPIRRLDTLFASGMLPRADYIKLDCEGFEPEVLLGAESYLKASAPICVCSESDFKVLPLFPFGHFHAVNEILVKHQLRVFDINMVRYACPSYQAARTQRPLPESDPMTDVPQLDVGAIDTLDVVFCRDLVIERRDRCLGVLQSLSVDRVIKAMINFELHGLMDCAYELATEFRDILAPRLDVDRAADLLLEKPPHARNTADVTHCLSMIAKLRARAFALPERTSKGASNCCVAPPQSTATQPPPIASLPDGMESTQSSVSSARIEKEHQAVSPVDVILPTTSNRSAFAREILADLIASDKTNQLRNAAVEPNIELCRRGGARPTSA
jgi:FkbM family methyltransferase